jgi:hypothetical protein
MADDMGLGKTIQLLTLIAWSFEKFSGLPPALVVAPVSLLENWRQEIERFFAADSLPVLTAYGDNLSALRVPRESIDAQLRGEGLVRFLRPGWRGNACVVLTTYETLRDLEFSFAMEDWSIMVCDEAQRIKNPNAMITRAAKKQKVRFRIACTGTPVENSLADLWCLYDFVQPGFLGALNEFGREYGRPIEQWEEGGREKLGETAARHRKWTGCLAAWRLSAALMRRRSSLPSIAIYSGCCNTTSPRISVFAQTSSTATQRLPPNLKPAARNGLTPSRPARSLALSSCRRWRLASASIFRRPIT